MTLNIREMLCGKIQRSHHVFRYSNCFVLHRENVAEHIFDASIFTMLLCRHFEAMGFNIDLGKALTRALVHDLEETVQGDVTRDVKYDGDGEIASMLHKMGDKIITSLESELGVSFYADWASAKDEDLEGAIVAFADLLTVTGYMIKEIKFGNSYMKDLFVHHLGWLHKFEGRLNRMEAVNSKFVRVMRDLHSQVLFIANGILDNNVNTATSTT